MARQLLNCLQIADDLISITYPPSLNRTAIAASLRALPHFKEVVEGIDSICVQFDPLTQNAQTLLAMLQKTAAHISDAPQANPDTFTIPIDYSPSAAPDLDQVCESLGIDRTAFITAHTSKTYPIEIIGFTPGFAYISGADWNIPRLKQPRIRVPAGSIGIAGGYTGIYALEGPGGWPLIGRTHATLFDAAQDDPFILKAGMQVKFEAVKS
ncbi:5-oxoprolinase subunit B family protein [Hirschia litorea]|uniref:Allophanate hydrolase subunit 1 n=1 Tax=Hirschia litorea TaxID=1199156 RepID=A0ABW2IMN1_9PROT